MAAAETTSFLELRRRAEQGDAEAQFSLGFRYGEGEGVPEDRQEALKWWRKAAEQGHAMAQYSLGVSYEIGEGVAQDSAEAVKWYRPLPSRVSPRPNATSARCTPRVWECPKIWSKP